MNQLHLTFPHAVPPTVAPPAADPARAARYLTVCAEHGEDPARLVAQVSHDRTDDPRELTAAEFDLLLEAWLQAHAGALIAPQPAPEDHPRIITRDECASAAVRINTDARITPATDPAVRVELERYTIAIGVDLLTVLRIYAARTGLQLRAITADAVTQLLDSTNDATDAPELPERWRAPANARTRLAARWPAGLPDRLRLAAGRTGRPAQELLAVALIPVVTPRHSRGR